MPVRVFVFFLLPRIITVVWNPYIIPSRPIVISTPSDSQYSRLVNVPVPGNRVQCQDELSARMGPALTLVLLSKLSMSKPHFPV